VSSATTPLEPSLDPGVVRQLKSATGHNIKVGGADSAGQAIKAGLVDELQLLQVPFVVGGASKHSPTVSARDLEVLDTQRFAGCAVYLRYRPKSA
jgi:riboflavin biosynthesis pyrimidine reductase